MEIISRLDTHTSIMHGEEIIAPPLIFLLKKLKLEYQKHKLKKTETILPGEQELSYLENRNYSI